MPRNVLEKKVRTYLKQSVALEELWSTPVTAEALGRELERMVKSTRMPDRLGELFTALGNDPFLIQECLVRQVLVDRLARNFFAYDQRFHAEQREAIEVLRAELASGRLDPFSDHPDRTVLELVRVDAGEGTEDPGERAKRHEPRRERLEPDEFDRWRSRLPERVGEIGPAVDERETFLVRVVLERWSDEIRVASYVVRKTAWDEWWGGVAASLEEASVEAGASNDDALPGIPSGGDPRSSAAPCVPDDTWDHGSLDDLPDPRSEPTAVWTGNLMIVWGGMTSAPVDTGGRYDPATDTWSSTSLTDAPSARQLHTAVWTGSRMVVWGGTAVNGGGVVNTGGRYDPWTDTWTPTSTTNAPSGRVYHTAVSIGSRMVAWGGFDGAYLNSGGQYDPTTDAWTPTSTTNAPAGRIDHTAVWTGSRMVVWGGHDSDFARLDTGGRYDPSTDSWSPTSTTNAPSRRYAHTAVSTGSRMVVWGGSGGGGSPVLNSGGHYDPNTDTWSPTSTTNAPSARTGHTAISTGSLMIVWGGGPSNTGGRYDPTTDTWTPTSTTNAPAARTSHDAVWTGSRMVVWGGGGTNTGGRYDPESDTWTPTSMTDGPSARANHTAVWTGSRMVVWGGGVNTGGRYEPATDTWTPTSTTNAPSARANHKAVWTGSRMVVWGGSVGSSYFDTGGRYDPATDTWTPTSTSNAPSGRTSHTAVWTGSLMVIWGGYDGGSPQPWTSTGGRYDPTTDTWTPTSTASAPLRRYAHTAVWTASHMIVWGGLSGEYLFTGGRYDPVTDTWTPTSAPGPPAGRADHTAVWTGSRMIVWGGGVNTGGRYDPIAETWTPTSTANAPSGRSNHTAVWTGSRMVVWGGTASNTGNVNTGGLYEPTTDTWTLTSMTQPPVRRMSHTAVWTGSFMMVWGGSSFGLNLGSGSRYALGQAVDNDGDGLSECQGDCNDADLAVFDVPHEIQNLRWLTGTQLAWDSDAANSGFGTKYDAMYGDLADVSFFGNGPDDVCLADNVSSPDVTDASPPPAAGQGWFFLVRGDNGCGKGRWETATGGSDRETQICP